MTPDYKTLSRGYSRNMSPAAIERRLDKVAELYELWKFLRTGKRVVRCQAAAELPSWSPGGHDGRRQSLERSPSFLFFNGDK